MKFGFLSGNILKIVACISMLLDHIGFIFFPQYIIFRVLGRIAFPIFAFMIAEGCFYTKNKLKRLLVMSSFALIMQIGLYMFTGMTDFNIFIHFSLSIIVIYLIDYIEEKIKNKQLIFAIITTLATLLLLAYLYWFSENYNYLYSNYGIFAIIMPVVLYVIKKYLPNINHIVCVPVICIFMYLMLLKIKFPYQLYGMMSCLFIILYNGKKGKLNLKYLFYIFYPLHFIILYGIQMLIGG
jgi:hypothetical protein